MTISFYRVKCTVTPGPGESSVIQLRVFYWTSLRYENQAALVHQLSSRDNVIFILNNILPSGKKIPSLLSLTFWNTYVARIFPKVRSGVLVNTVGVNIGTSALKCLNNATRCFIQICINL